MELSESPSLRAKAFAMPHVLGLTTYLLSELSSGMGLFL